MIDRNKINTLLVEKYRPQTLDEFVGNSDVKKKIQSYFDNNDVPHLLFCGKAGGGKTTLAKIIVKNIDCDHLYINASDENSVDIMRNKIQDFASSVGWKSYKIIILDEADFLTPQAQAALRNIMEKYSKHCRFILTANYAERIIEPIQSRCQIYKLFPPSKKDVGVRMVEILKAEGIKFSIEDVAKIVENHYPDIRATINSLDKQIITNTLRIDTMTEIDSEYKNNLITFLQIPDKKEAWKMCRQSLLNAGLRDFNEIFSYLYQHLDDYGKGKTSSIILVLAEYGYKDSLVVDKEINFAAMLVELIQTLHS